MLIKNLMMMRMIHLSISIMHQSFVVMANTGPGNSGAFNFLVLKALLNALHCQDKFMVKSLLKVPPSLGQCLFPGIVFSLLQKSIWSGLLDTPKFKGEAVCLC